MKKSLIYSAFLFLIFSPISVKATVLPCFGVDSSTCSSCNYDIKWSDCVDGKQYSSFVKIKECTGDYTPPAYQNCTAPVAYSQCQESSYIYGEWTPCVNGVSVRTAFYDNANNGSCIAHPEFPVIKKSCNILPVCEESSFNYSEWSACSNNITLRSATKIKECTGNYIPLTQKDCPVIQSTNGTSTLPVLLIKSPKVDSAFTKKQVGKILLQVESHGEAWYVNPKDSKMYYMADGDKAYNVMRNLGVGITNKDLTKIQANKTLAKKNAGKIFLQIESRGEAYYIDFNGVAHYLKDGAAAYEIMRSLGLGITDNNLNKIPEGSL